MKVVLLKKVAGASGFYPAGTIVDFHDAHARIMMANRHAQMIGADGKPIPLPPRAPTGVKSK